MGIQSFPIATPTPVQTTPVKGTSLAEMMQMAQSAQALQQAQQLNPLQLQKAQLELQQLQQLNPLAVQEAEAKVETAQTGAKQTKQNYLVSGEDYSRKMINALPPINEYCSRRTSLPASSTVKSFGFTKSSS